MVLSQGEGSSPRCSRVLLPHLLWVQVFDTLVPVPEKTRGHSEGVTVSTMELGVRV